LAQARKLVERFLFLSWSIDTITDISKKKADAVWIFTGILEGRSPRWICEYVPDEKSGRWKKMRESFILVGF
jgi:hypothetical protein